MEDHWKNSAKDCTSLSVWIYYSTFGAPLAKLGKKLQFSQFRLYYEIFGGPLTKSIFPQSAWTTVHLLAKWHSGAKKCLKVRQVLGTTNSKVWMLLTTLKTWQSEAKNCTIPHSACTMVHLVAQWQSGAKNYTFPHSAYTMVHLVAHSASSMEHLVAHWQSGPKIALFHSQPVLWYIWWSTGKVVQKIALFPI